MGAKQSSVKRVPAGPTLTIIQTWFNIIKQGSPVFLLLCHSLEVRCEKKKDSCADDVVWNGLEKSKKSKLKLVVVK